MVDSMIVLFESISTEYITNGLGALPDAISCVVTEERNGEYELEMEYPITGKRYSDLMLRRIIVAKSNPYSDAQPFRIYSISKPINGVVTINAEHISYDLSGIPVSPFSSDSAVSAFVKMKEASTVPCPFTFWTDKTTKATMEVTKPSSIRSLLGGVNGSILDVYGGEYEFDKYMIKLHNSRGTNRGVTIRYGKNLTDLKQEENCSAVYTGVYPFWYSEQDGLMTLKEKIIEADGTYNFTRIYPLDLSQEWQEKPTENQLKERAKSYMVKNRIGVPKVSLDVSFVQLAQSEEYKDIAILETVYLCDTVNVEFPELGVSATAKCNKTVFNVLTNKYNKIELGDAKSNLASTISEQSKDISNVPTKNFMEQAIENATQMITGGLGGYVVMHSSTGGKHPDEILIMDTDNINTATKVWRWNKGGLGYSGTGYMGPYATAITADGRIVADFITAGEFDGALIKAGTILSDMLSVEYKNSVTEEINGMGTEVTKELTTLIENTADSIRLLCKTIEEHNMHDYVTGGDFVGGFTDEWYSSNSNNQVITHSKLGTCAKILKSSTTSSYIRCSLGKLPAGTYRIRYEAATDAGYESTARIQCSLYSSATTASGFLKSAGFTTIEREVTLPDSTANRYIYFYAYTQGAPVYIKDVEVFGQMSVYSETQLKVNSDAITAEAIRAQSAESTMKAQIKTAAEAITLKVSKDDVESIIEQNADTIRLKANKITWSSTYSSMSSSGVLKCSDAQVKGTFQCGSDSGYWVKLVSSGKMTGGNGSTEHGYIDYSASARNVDTGVIHKGIQVKGGCLRISVNELATRSTSNVDTLAYIGATGRLKYISQIDDLGGGSIQWWTSYINFENGLMVSSL